MSLSPGTRLGTYEIVAPIGAGGMGEVYRARDRKLDRDVAIKVLPESVAADREMLARFEREAKAVAALSNPHILAIHDFGTEDGVAYAVMELLEGQTVRGRLDAGPLSEKEALDYALQMAKGLSAAHQKGIVHRDLKPENLFVSKEGHLKILDFGLAKRIAKAPAEGVQTPPTITGGTETGAIMGTVGYMSPEQVRGLSADHRSDIFSFGTILYELLSGERAFSRQTAGDTLAAILLEEPPNLSESGRNVLPAVERIVRRCLEKDRNNRFQSAKDVMSALSEALTPTAPRLTPLQAPAPALTPLPELPTGRRKVVLIFAAVVVVVALTALGILFLWHSPKEEASGVKRIAVLPFENIGAAEDDYFTDGISDEIRTKLTMLPALEVIARGSSTPYKKTTKTPTQIAEELTVRYLLTATVRWQKGAEQSRVHVTPELVEVRESGAPASRWQQPFHAALTDVFQVQSDIASQVSAALGVALGSGEEKRLAERPTQHLAAYDEYLKGQQAFQYGSTPAELRKAIELYERAVALDSTFAPAWAQLARAHAQYYYEVTPTSVGAARAHFAVERAIALAPGRPESQLALGDYRLLVRKNPAEALAAHAAGLRIAPTNADLLSATAVAGTILGRWEAALAHDTRASALDPRSARVAAQRAVRLLWLRRYPEAQVASDRALSLAPTDIGIIEDRAMVPLAQGDLAGARAVLHAVPHEVDPAKLVVVVAHFWDLVWVLDDQQQRLLLGLGPDAFNNDRGIWGLVLAQAHALRGDPARTRVYAESARIAFEEQLKDTPDDAQRHVLLGLALAYLGVKANAMREGERGVALMPVTRDALTGPYLQHQLARIYILVGEPEKALDQLEPLLKIPYYLSPGWLKIDPNFDPLRSNPRFQRLVAGS
jgi:serine/threonine protein kinase/tetratricopeptide (TPR) repeat protein